MKMFVQISAKKALILLEFLIQSGSEAVIAYAKDNLYVVKTLKEFQYIDDEGRDQGMNGVPCLANLKMYCRLIPWGKTVRQKSKDVTALLNDEGRVSQLREAKRTGGRTAGAQYTGEVEFHTPRLPGGATDDAELQKAIEESKRTARLEEKRRKQDEGSYVIYTFMHWNALLISKNAHRDHDLQKALELSEREAIERRMRERDTLVPQLTGNSDHYQPYVFADC
jgi:epsin